MTSADIAYLAGFFDGEGCITLDKQPTGRYGLKIQVTGTDLPSIQRYREVFQLGVVKEKHERNEHRKQAWVWIAKTRHAEVVLRLLLPYLRVKAAQAQLALDFRDRVQAQPRGHGPTVEEHIKFYMELKGLKVQQS